MTTTTRRRLTAADLTASKPPEPAQPAPEPAAEPQAPPAWTCTAPRSHAGCLFGVDPFPDCAASFNIRRGCPYARST